MRWGIIQLGQLSADWQGKSRIVFNFQTLIYLRKFLTPPPSSTDVERLFSVAGLIAADNRARLAPETLEKLLFLCENILVLNFELDWD